MFECQVDRTYAGSRWLFQLLAAALAFLPRAGAEEGVAATGPLTGVVWEAPLPAGAPDYTAAVDALFIAFETETARRLVPGERGRAGLKVNTRSGEGLSTPLPLLRAIIGALEARGFEAGSILIVDDSTLNLRQAGILSPLSEASSIFEGCPVLALDSGRYYETDWFYDSPLPPALHEDSVLFTEQRQVRSLEAGAVERRSYLPAPLLFEVDFWINLPVAVDSPALGIDGALANATLWNVSNSERFLVNRATASAAVAEIAAIPELRERMILHIASLERYQFIGGPGFRSLYTRSEPLLWMSADPVALDRLLLERINTMRRLEGFPEITPVPAQLPFAASLGLGTDDRSQIHIERVQVGASTRAPADSTSLAPDFPAAE